MDVPPHPHTGLQTVSWLFEGVVQHDDSGGVSARVLPGEVNLMTAGSGICHTDLHVMKGEVGFLLPGVLGHEISGVVAEVGRGVTTVRPGDRVALVLPNSPQHLIAFFAVLRLGAVVVEHNPQYTAHELAPLFAHHGARIALVWDEVAAVVDGLASTVIPVSLEEPFPLSGAPVPHRQAALADAALILYTSGTTGQPKGVVLTHGNLAANCIQLEAQADLRPGHERFLATLPMFHSYGLTMSVLLAVRCAAEIILLPDPRPAAGRAGGGRHAAAAPGSALRLSGG